MKKAFTLAEVLITLTIIGVIAVLTIPNLMKKWEDQHTVSAVKEAYSIIDNAIKMAVYENGTFDEWTWPTYDYGNRFISQDYMGELLKNYMKIQKFCPSQTHNPCIPYNKKYKVILYLNTYK